MNISPGSPEAGSPKRERTTVRFPRPPRVASEASVSRGGSLDTLSQVTGGRVPPVERRGSGNVFDVLSKSKSKSKSRTRSFDFDFDLDFDFDRLEIGEDTAETLDPHRQIHDGARMTRSMHRLLLAACAALAIAACGSDDDSGTADIGAGGPIPPLSSEGRWFTDATGRVVLMHGFNQVSKSAPYYPAAFGFGDDDAAYLAGEGFNAIRLGIDFRGLMPEPGEVSAEYIENIAASVDALAAHEIFVLLDFHQDGFAPKYNGNGLPDWMAIDDGLPNPPDAVFPLYYVQNPAMQRAFESFWQNRSIPGGIGVQDYYAQGVAAVAARFGGDPWVIGYDLMNEPWPGADWQPCSTAAGCPDLEAQYLDPFHHKMGEVIRAASDTQLVFAEPFVLFNFGQGPTTLPGTEPRTALSFHSYAVDVAGEEAVLRFGVEAATRDGAPVMVTEFGASIDPILLDRLANQLDAELLPWFDWQYPESIIADAMQPAGDDNLRSLAAFEALVRPYPTAIAGTPTHVAFDAETKVFELEYDTTSPAGERLSEEIVTVVYVPARHYPAGYSVAAEGANVTSAPCAPLLVLRTEGAVQNVAVTVSPATGGCI